MQKESRDFIFTDDAGRNVAIPANLERIIPSGKIAQMVLFPLVPEMFAGLAAKWDDSAKGIIPDEYFNLPYYGSFYGETEMNREELSKANPQLVIDIGTTRDGNSENLDDFTAQTGVPIVFISADLATMPETYEKLGRLLGREERAKELSDWCAKIYGRAEKIAEIIGDDKERGIFVLGEQGLNVIANSSYQAEVIDMFLDNVAVVEDPSRKGTGNEVSMEQIAAWNPDFIIFKYGSIYDTVKNLPVWPGLNAIAGGNYVESPQTPDCWIGVPPAVQRYLALIWLPAVLYPEYVDYDVKAEIKEAYEMLYHTKLTDAQYESITENAFLK